MLERLQKVLAGAGVASRRACETLITSGRVSVNGKVVCELGTRVDPEQDRVMVDGALIRPPDYIYILLHKPVGVVSTVQDPYERMTVIDLLDIPERVFPIGRLDADSEGLLLLTNDGALANQLTHPRFQVEKEYHVLLSTVPTPAAIQQWRKGVVLEGTRTARARVELLNTEGTGAWVRIVMREGRKRQIREVAKLLGYRTLRLIRVREGPLHLGHIQPGKWRKLSPAEVEALRKHSAHPHPSR